MQCELPASDAQWRSIIECLFVRQTHWVGVRDKEQYLTGDYQSSEHQTNFDLTFPSPNFTTQSMAIGRDDISPRKWLASPCSGSLTPLPACLSFLLGRWPVFALIPPLAPLLNSSQSHRWDRWEIIQILLPISQCEHIEAWPRSGYSQFVNRRLNWDAYRLVGKNFFLSDIDWKPYEFWEADCWNICLVWGNFFGQMLIDFVRAGWVNNWYVFKVGGKSLFRALCLRSSNSPSQRSVLTWNLGII